MDQALVLNSSFEPINVVPWQKAMQMIFQGKVEILEESERTVRTITTSYRLPSVLRLLRYIPLKKKRHIVRFSRDNILVRDRNTCQYCGRIRSSRELTLDHVIPSAQGGKKNWENIVAACLPCNQRKGGRTPSEAGMRLLAEPTNPLWLPNHEITYDLQFAPEKWKVYLSWQHNLKKA
jgi:5-methylcytosine-specific restriction endonuclease McrA